MKIYSLLILFLGSVVSNQSELSFDLESLGSSNNKLTAAEITALLENGNNSLTSTSKTQRIQINPDLMQQVQMDSQSRSQTTS